MKTTKKNTMVTVLEAIQALHTDTVDMDKIKRDYLYCIVDNSGNISMIGGDDHSSKDISQEFTGEICDYFSGLMGCNIDNDGVACDGDGNAYILMAHAGGPIDEYRVLRYALVSLDSDLENWKDIFGHMVVTPKKINKFPKLPDTRFEI